MNEMLGTRARGPLEQTFCYSSVSAIVSLETSLLD